MKNLVLSTCQETLETMCAALSGNGAIIFAIVFFWSFEDLKFQSGTDIQADWGNLYTVYRKLSSIIYCLETI